MSFLVTMKIPFQFYFDPMKADRTDDFSGHDPDTPEFLGK